MSENTNLKIALDNAADLLSNNNLNECIEQLEEILAVYPLDTVAQTGVDMHGAFEFGSAA